MCKGGPAATARLLLSPSAVESTPVLQDLYIFGSFRMWICLDISAGSYCQSLLSAGGHTESTHLLTGPGLISWALGCTLGTLLVVQSIREHNLQALISVGK